ncbi:MAG: pyroglutamyl-peptidase I [Candidatus Binataceae bacterium]
MARTILLTGFAPFRGEPINPSWEVARRLDGESIGGLTVTALRIPVGCAIAARRIADAIDRLKPNAVLGLGEAGGRPAISLELVAVNIADERGRMAKSGDPGRAAVIRRGPAAYFARLPLDSILRALDRHDIPASVSLTAGAHACNALMYAALHRLRDRPEVPVGFIHLPYASPQSRRHRTMPSLPLATMEQAIRIAIEAIARTV